jgi:hypothetical protein
MSTTSTTRFPFTSAPASAIAARQLAARALAARARVAHLRSLLVLFALAVVSAGCGYHTELCSMSGEPLAVVDLSASHDEDGTPVLSFDGGHTGYQVVIRDRARNQEMWNIWVYTDEAANTGNMDANHVIGSPIRYGDADLDVAATVDANEALPLEDGRIYDFLLGRGCFVPPGGNSANSILGEFIYRAPAMGAEGQE